MRPVRVMEGSVGNLPVLVIQDPRVSRPPSGMAPMDQYLPQDTSLVLGESTDFPFLPAPRTPQLIVEEMVPGSVVGSPSGEPVATASQSMPDLSREGPFDVHQDASGSGDSPRVLDSLRGCQYCMTSYDEDTNMSEFNPAYGIHLHDPRLPEYVGAPDSARLLSRSPEYWLHRMGHERTLSAALQLQHDAVLIEPSGYQTVRHLPQPDVLGGHAGGV